MHDALRNRDPRVHAALLCDEVREEQGGKLIILGVYTGDVVVGGFPATFAPAMYVELLLTGGPHEVGFRFRVGDKVHSSMLGTAVLFEDGVAGLSTPKLPMMITEESDLFGEAQVDGQDWFVVLAKKIQSATHGAAAAEINPAVSNPKAKTKSKAKTR